MAVDNRLKDYFRLASLWHRTGDTVWLQFLENMTRMEGGPGVRAALKLLTKEEFGGLHSDTS